MELTWDGETWTTEVDLPSWADHLPPRTGGRVRIAFSPESASESVRPTKTQLATVERLRDEQAELLEAVSLAIRKHYESVRPRYLKYSVEHPGFFSNFQKQMPAAPDDKAFARLHQLQQINVHTAAKSRVAYCGLEFHATWDVEHGLGVVVHRTEVLRVSGADAAITEWMPEAAAVPKEPAPKKPAPKKPAPKEPATKISRPR